MDRWADVRLVVCAAAALACAPVESREVGGTMDARWSGGETGAFRGPAIARWCAEPRFGEVLGVRGDTGIAIAIRRADSLVPGRYQAVLPDSADTARPSATVALRFLGRTIVSGYQSDSGTVTIARDADGRLDLAFDVRAKVPGLAGRITLRGEADGVPVQPGGEECTTRRYSSE